MSAERDKEEEEGGEGRGGKGSSECLDYIGKGSPGLGWKVQGWGLGHMPGRD